VRRQHRREPHEHARSGVRHAAAGIRQLAHGEPAGDRDRKLEKQHGITATLRQTRERLEKRDSLPYAVDVVCLDQQGVVFNIARFFSSRGIDIAELSTRSYAAAHTGAPMYSVQMNVSVPERIHIAQLREEFMEMCDQYNLDAILEPVKA